MCDFEKQLRLYGASRIQFCLFIMLLLIFRVKGADFAAEVPAAFVATFSLEQQLFLMQLLLTWPLERGN